MRQVRYRAVITLDPEEELRELWRWPRSGTAARPSIPYPRPAAQTGPGSMASAAASPAGVAEIRRRYHNRTHDLMVRAASLGLPARSRSFPAELCWDDEMPLRPGDRHVVTITVTDDDAPAFLSAGQRFTLWDGGEVGHGTISRQVFTDYGPS